MITSGEPLVTSPFCPERIRLFFDKSSRSDKVPHTVLFSGDSGYGSLFVAWAFSQNLLGIFDGDTATFRKKRDAEKVRLVNHPDLMFIYPTAITEEVKQNPTFSDFSAVWQSFLRNHAFGNADDWFDHIGVKNSQPAIRVSDVEAVVKFANMAPVFSDRKIIFIYLPEYLSTICGNKLLKILEEPPEKVTFVAVIQNQKKLLPTLLSRFQTHELFPYPDEVVHSFLEHQGVEKKHIDFLVSQSFGNLREALRLADQRKGKEIPLDDLFAKWMRACYKADFLTIHLWTQELQKLGKQQVVTFLKFSIERLREVFLLHYEKKLSFPKEKLLGSLDLDKLSHFIGAENFESIYETISKTIQSIEKNANAEMALWQLSVKICRFIRKK